MHVCLYMFFVQHLPEGYPRDFPLPSGRTDLFSVHVDYVAHETRVLLHVDPVTVHLPSMVSRDCCECVSVLCTS